MNFSGAVSLSVSWWKGGFENFERNSRGFGSKEKGGNWDLNQHEAAIVCSNPPKLSSRVRNMS